MSQTVDMSVLVPLTVDLSFLVSLSIDMYFLSLTVDMSIWCH